MEVKREEIEKGIREVFRAVLSTKISHLGIL